MNYFSRLSGSGNKQGIYLLLIIFTAIVLRIFFFNGLVFSDDSYYNKLATTLLSGDFAKDYIGYPIFLIRKGQALVTALFFFVFGENELTSVAFPFILSLSSIFLVYKFCELFFHDKNISIIASFLWAFSPVDIIFASINFTDLQAAFFINTGIYFLYKSHKLDKIHYSFFAGILFSISLLFKENLLFVMILLVLLSTYLLYKTRKINKHLALSLIVVFVFVIAEGIIYYLSSGNLDYRFTILKENYLYCYYDFFPYTLLGSEYNSTQYTNAVMKQIFILNPKYLFLRRYYLGIPFISLSNIVLLIKEKREKLLVFWGIGMIVLLLFMTTSFSDYKPFDLRRSWYIYIALMPFILLVAQFISRFNMKIRSVLLIFYSVFSIYMCFEYQKFFNVSEGKALKQYVKSLDDSLIYTDLHTKYGLDIIRKNGYKNDTRIILGKFYDLKELPADSYLIYNKDEVAELSLQGNIMPDFNVLNEKEFERVNNFGRFIIYRKN